MLRNQEFFARLVPTTVLCVLFLFKIQFVASDNCHIDNPKTTEGRLKKHLLCDDYDKESLPNVNTTVIKITMHIKDYDYDDISGQFAVDTWILMSWKDSNLKWNPSEFDDEKTIVLHSDEIWMPDFTGFHTATSTQFSEACAAVNCEVSYSGKVSCIPPCSYKTTCDRNYRNWPKDRHECALGFGAWIHRADMMYFKDELSAVDYSTLEHKEWKIIETKVENKQYNTSDSEIYSTVAYTFSIQRYSASEMLLVVSPAIILATLNLCVLWLSPECKERIYIVLLSLLSHFMYNESMWWNIPRNGDEAPVVLIFFRNSMLISTAIILETLIMRGLLTSKSTIPQWVSKSVSTLRDNKLGQHMFTNPYIIDDKSDDDTQRITDDSSNVLESQPAIDSLESGSPETTSAKGKSKIWMTTVRVIDYILFLTFVICYVIMFIAWFPSES
ncbi:nAChRa9 family protein [Megaselia abdita]